jgi:hypothetical protein
MPGQNYGAESFFNALSRAARSRVTTEMRISDAHL